MTKTNMIRPWRRLAETAQAVIIIGLPFLRINGESALRFDIPTLRLYFFGSGIWMEEFFIVLVAIIFLTSLAVFITLVFGRIWCGWVCPQTAIIDFTPFIDRAISKGPLYKLGAYSTLFLISALVAANLIWYFISPYEFIPEAVKGDLGNVVWGFWTVLTGILFLNFALLRHKFCATVCPYAKLQSVLFDNKTLVISFDPQRKEECMECMACVRSCPVGIDIRKGLNPACISCAECVDTCTRIMERRKRRSLIGYFFGLPGEGGRILRQNALMTGSVTAVFLVFFIYLLLTRTSVDMTILPNYSYPPRIAAAGGAAINSYILSVKNRGRTEADLLIAAHATDAGNVEIIPGRFSIGAGEMKKVPVYVTVRNLNGGRTVSNIDISIGSDRTDAARVTKQVHFIYPDT